MDVSRELGRLRSARRGPTLVVVGGLHGNEPGGVLAAERVLEALRVHALPLSGELVALAGNVGALRERRRYLVKDLNRQWTEAKVAALRQSGARGDDPEDAEQRALLEAMEDAIGRARGHEVHAEVGAAPPRRRFEQPLEIGGLLQTADHGCGA